MYFVDFQQLELWTIDMKIIMKLRLLLNSVMEAIRFYIQDRIDNDIKLFCILLRVEQQ